MSKINVFKSQFINASDTVNAKTNDYYLDGVNTDKEKRIIVYIYSLPKFPTHGYKVGMATCHSGEVFWEAIKKRIANQQNELALTDDQYQKYGMDREVVYWGVCLDANNESFKDYFVHDKIKYMYAGLTIKEQEWFNGIPLDDLIEAFNKCRIEGYKPLIYNPRKEQQECIDQLKNYFDKNPIGGRFLLNCKMRFGKCYTTYKYCEENNINKILILTFIPAVQKSWEEDLTHIKKKYKYFTDYDLKKDDFSLEEQQEPYVLFLSLQNYLGKEYDTNSIKQKILKLKDIDFDLVVLDEYHFGAWNDRTQETLEDFDPVYAKQIKKGETADVIKKFDIKTKKTICLSGTPFKALARGEFLKENTFTYSYFDEQKNKYPNSINNDFSVICSDYEAFPDMKIFGYNMSALYKGMTATFFSDDKLLGNKYFSLNKFFETKKDSNEQYDYEFVYDEEVKKWLEIIKGKSTFGGEFPYSNMKMLQNNKHTLWLMPTVNSCKAMENLLKNDDYFSKYEIINLSCNEVGTGQKALDYLMLKIKSAENTGKLGTIAITVNKLTIGVTVKPWMSVFVLKDLASPEQYFQSIFRIQTPFVKDGKILKKNGYVYDFNMDRASALMLKFAEQSQDSTTTRMEIAKLIVKYMPIFMNGDMSAPIGYDVFYDLAMYGDNKGVSLSKRIRDIEKTTRMLDDDVVSCMLNDPEVSEIIKHVFAHAKFTKEKTKTLPSTPPSGFNSEAGRKGQDDGYACGVKDSGEYIDFDDEIIQQRFDENLTKYINEMVPNEYDELNQSYYSNGFRKGYESGVNAPIKKLQCGKQDGIKFSDQLKEELGDNIFYDGDGKVIIDNKTKTYLNDNSNIPKEYSSMLYRRWYKDSFLKAVRNRFRRPKPVAENQTVESANNVIQHLIARLFQFLYISVYRETTFSEIFQNADPNTFLEAVGITKKDFEILNRYHAFQEDVLNNYIHEFFVNESLGSSLNFNDDFVRKNYRNSFEWFGFSDLSNSNTNYEKLQVYEEITMEETAYEEKFEEEKKDHTKKEIDIENLNLNDLEKKVYVAIYNICLLSEKIHCKSYFKTIKNYLIGNSKSVFYPYFANEEYCGSFGFINAFKIEKICNELVKKKYVKIENYNNEKVYVPVNFDK